jgi:hypothetical protein
LAAAATGNKLPIVRQSCAPCHSLTVCHAQLLDYAPVRSKCSPTTAP